MIQIFVNENKIVLSNEALSADSIQYSKQVDFKKIVMNLFQSNQKSINIYNVDLELLWLEFQNQFKVLEAAGGLVENSNNEFLLIFRLGKWDLPKGKMETGESKEETAIREVEEECGISNLELKHQLLNTYHIYQTKKNTILKITYWFKMNYTGNESLIPQTEEYIEQVKWVHKNEFKTIEQNTYENIKLVLNLAE